MTDLQIRLVSADDLDALSRLDPMSGIEQARLNYQSASDTRLFAAAWEGDQPLGWGILDMSAEELTPELSHLWVAPSARRRGVGRALTTWLEQKAREAGLDEVFLLVDPRNAAAVPMYVDLDYSPTGDHRHNIDIATGEQGHHAIYRKSLTMGG